VARRKREGGGDVSESQGRGRRRRRGRTQTRSSSPARNRGLSSISLQWGEGKKPAGVGGREERRGEGRDKEQGEGGGGGGGGGKVVHLVLMKIFFLFNIKKFPFRLFLSSSPRSDPCCASPFTLSPSSFFPAKLLSPGFSGAFPEALFAMPRKPTPPGKQKHTERLKEKIVFRFGNSAVNAREKRDITNAVHDAISLAFEEGFVDAQAIAEALWVCFPNQQVSQSSPFLLPHLKQPLPSHPPYFSFERSTPWRPSRKRSSTKPPNATRTTRRTVGSPPPHHPQAYPPPFLHFLPCALQIGR
jgi:hypothetical protein